VLVASGAKVTGASVPPASLVLGGTERAGVLPGYLQQNRARLGDGTSENVALVRSYLRQLRSLQRAFHESAGSAEGLERVAVHRIHLALGYQMAELASWLHRYLDLVRISAERIAQGLPYEGNIERHKRLSARLSDQRKIAEVAPAQIADLERMREEARKESEALFALAAPERLADEHRHRWTTRALRQPEVLRLLPPATVSDEVEARAAVQASREHHEIGRLFGTSGIRGVFQRGSALSPISAFEREGVITPALGYLLGRALGRLLQRPGHPRAAGIALDGRVSGPRIAAPLRDGLCDEGIDVLDEGVCTTPAAASLPDRLSLIVTASHSPPTHNGVKVYLDGVPLSRDHENEVEEEMRVLETLVLRGRALAPMRAARERGQVRDATQDAADHHRTRLRAELEHLGLAGKLRGRRLPIDLARGAAAAKPGGEEIVPSPAMAMYLEEGVVLVAYGGERDGERINDRLGAAYPYGEVRYLAEGSERDVHPAAGELLALARGAYGYGAGRTADGHAAGLPASRTIYWPASLELPTTLRRFARPVAGGHLAFLDVDSPGSEAMRSGLEAVLAKMPLLTAISVDGDADRVLLTDPEAARRDIPFLTGDALLMVFAAYDPDNVRRVVFTVESDLTLEKFLTAREIPFDVVTVGDRAVAECILARARTSGVDGAFLLGGEPSGHLIFTVPDGDDLRLIEDPFAVHLRALALVERQGRSLGEMLFGLSEQVVEAPAARKPDAWAPDPATGGGGLTLAEKAQLTLRGRGQSALSDYASRFVPECLRIFGNGYARAFHGERAEAEPLLSEAFDNLCAGRGEAAAGKREVRIGEIAVSVGGAVEERITAALQITAIPYFGPDDVVLRFYAPDADGLPCKIGEIVARNSGTAAKNAAYVKLWPVHPGSGRRLDPDGLREVVDEMARQRAAFTDRYVLDYLRRR
jgi:phosphomannomutase